MYCSASGTISWRSCTTAKVLLITRFDIVLEKPTGLTLDILLLQEKDLDSRGFL